MRFGEDVRSDVSSCCCGFVLLAVSLSIRPSLNLYLSQVDQLRQAVRNLKSEQNRLTGELEREREDHGRWVLSVKIMCSNQTGN